MPCGNWAARPVGRSGGLAAVGRAGAWPHPAESRRGNNQRCREPGWPSGSCQSAGKEEPGPKRDLSQTSHGTVGLGRYRPGPLSADLLDPGRGCSRHWEVFLIVPWEWLGLEHMFAPQFPGGRRERGNRTATPSLTSLT